MFNVILGGRSCNNSCSGKAISITFYITYYDCVFVALVTKYVMRMRPIVILACPTLEYFSTLPHKRHNFRKQSTDHKTCVLIFSTRLCETIAILRRTEQDMLKNIYRSSCMVTVIIVSI